jgi:hypothetical protein
MRNRNPIRAIAGAVALLLATSSAAPAEDWAREMFNHTSHDFGTVARGAKAEHRFVVENIFVEDAHIASVRSSCGCTVPTATQQTLKTWQKAEIVATLDTRGFYGRKDATITVTFDQPFPAEVQLQVHCNIRGDVVVQPGEIQFGSVAQGAAAQQKVAVSYAGRANWHIKQVDCANSHLSAQAVETGRSQGTITYDLVVKLKEDTPAGYLRDQIFLVTDDPDPQAARVPVPVEGMVRSAIAVTPSPLWMGAVEAGSVATRQLVVHGSAPFRIVGIQSSDKRFQCAVPETSGSLYRLPVVFTADKTPGRTSAKIRIETDGGGGKSTLEVGVDAQVVPRETEEKPQSAVKPEAGGRREL